MSSSISSSHSEFFEAGDIVIVNLPFSSISGSKTRPVLVISSAEFNQRARDLIVAKITGSSYDERFEIDINSNDLVEGKLKKISFIDLAFITTLEQNLIVRKIGKLTNKKLKSTKMVLKQVFDV